MSAIQRDREVVAEATGTFMAADMGGGRYSLIVTKEQLAAIQRHSERQPKYDALVDAVRDLLGNITDDLPSASRASHALAALDRDDTTTPAATTEKCPNPWCQSGREWSVDQWMGCSICHGSGSAPTTEAPIA